MPACCAELLIDFVRIDALNGDVAFDEMKHQVASLGGERTPQLKKNRTIRRDFDRRDSQNARGQLDITIDARASGFHACSTGITDLASVREIVYIDIHFGSYLR